MESCLDSFYRPVYCFFTRKVKKDSYFKELDFSAQSVQSLRPGTTKILNVFNYFMF